MRTKLPGAGGCEDGASGPASGHTGSVSPAALSDVRRRFIRCLLQAPRARPGRVVIVNLYIVQAHHEVDHPFLGLFGQTSSCFWKISITLYMYKPATKMIFRTLFLAWTQDFRSPGRCAPTHISPCGQKSRVREGWRQKTPIWCEVFTCTLASDRNTSNPPPPAESTSSSCPGFLLSSCCLPVGPGLLF